MSKEEELVAELAKREAIVVAALGWMVAGERFSQSAFMRANGMDLSRLEPNARALYEATRRYADDLIDSVVDALLQVHVGGVADARETFLPNAIELLGKFGWDKAKALEHVSSAYGDGGT